MPSFISPAITTDRPGARCVNRPGLPSPSSVMTPWPAAMNFAIDRYDRESGLSPIAGLVTAHRSVAMPSDITPMTTAITSTDRSGRGSVVSGVGVGVMRVCLKDGGRATA